MPRSVLCVPVGPVCPVPERVGDPPTTKDLAQCETPVEHLRPQETRDSSVFPGSPRVTYDEAPRPSRSLHECQSVHKRRVLQVVGCLWVSRKFNKNIKNYSILDFVFLDLVVVGLSGVVVSVLDPTEE